MQNNPQPNIWQIEPLTQCNEKAVEQVNNLLEILSTKTYTLNLNGLQTVLNAGTVILVAKVEEEIVGMATLATAPCLTGHKGLLEDVVVHPKMQGKGLGKALVNQILAVARQKGLQKVDLTSSPKRIAANQLYRSLGFEQRQTNVYRYKANKNE